MKQQTNIKKRYAIKLPSLPTLGIIFGIGLIIGYLGPFGSFVMPLLQRLLYWVVVIFIGYFIYHHVLHISRWLFADKEINKYIKFIIPSIIAAFLLAICINFLIYLFFAQPVDLSKTILRLFPQVLILGWIISFIIGLINSQFWKVLDNHDSTNTVPTIKPGKLFIDRIPHHLGEQLLCFVMEDHYLKVYTHKGEHMILMRMKDALNELQDYNGLQVHRSWWVAIDAVSKVKKSGRNIRLTLKNGLEVPVSRTYAKKIKEVKLFF
ncbi:MAG: LytTR family transcriptional regulator [Proteobacteria bacterium]|nr:LytTR family transcriptional regulator [Pseudomonadota bacterium]